MLSTEHQITLQGFTLFRDLTDKRKFYYLPKSKVNIAGNGKKLNFAAFTSSKLTEIKEGEPNGQELSGGFLTMEVELEIPSEEELNSIQKTLPRAWKELVEKKAKDGELVAPQDEVITDKEKFILTPVPFKGGDVKLLILGEDGTAEKSLAKVKVVGSQKPSLYDKENAVFSVRLGAEEAEIMYNLLTQGKIEDNKPMNSQLAVMYDLTYKGIEPAHYVKITVDFNAAEDYWNHNFTFDGDFKYGKNSSQSGGDKDKYNISIIADVDVDAMFRELINKGAIIIQKIDYNGNDVGSPLGANDPSGIDLVKRLLSSELFTPTPLPNENYSALNKLGKIASDSNPALNNTKTEEEKTEEEKTEEGKPEEGKPEEHNSEEQKPDEQEKEDSSDDEKNSDSNKTNDEEESKNQNDADKTDSKEGDSKLSTVSSVNWNLNAKIGYSFKKRNLKETLKRTYIFNKQSAIDQTIHPCGMITVEGTAFNAAEQVYLGRFGDKVFREHEITFRAGMDFETYNVKSIEVDVKLPGSTGTHFSLTKERPSYTFKFNSETFGIGNEGNLQYKTNFIFDTTKLIGFDTEKSEDKKEAYISTSEKAIVIRPEDFKKSIRPLNIMTGSLSANNIDSAIVSIFKMGKESKDLGTRIFNQKVGTSGTDNFILLNSENSYEAQIQYNFTDKLHTTSKRLVVSTKDFKDEQLVIEDPTSGMIKICTADGKDTFEKVRSIDVTLQQNNQTPQLVQLRKSVPERYLIVDNTIGENAKIKVTSVKVNYREKEQEEYSPLNILEKEFSVDTSEIVLDI